MLVEEFKWCINSDFRAFLNEKEVENLDLAARLADDYSLTHKASFVNKPFSRKPFNPQLKFTPQSRPFSPQSKPYSPQSGLKSNHSNPSDNSSHSFTPKPRFSGENKGQSPLSQPICNYCKQSGHIISECIALKRKREKERQESSKPTGLTSLRLKPQSSVQDENPILEKTSETDAVMEIYEPFLSDGSVSLNSDFAQSIPIKILRDTGASQSLILADTLPFSERTSSGTSVLSQGVECGFINVPLHNIYLSSALVTGLVAVGIRPSLPFKGVHLLLGNDLAGDKVVVDPLLTSTPCVDQPTDPIEQEIPDLNPSCAVTTAMAKKANQNYGMQDINLADTLIGQSFNDEISNSLSPSQSDIQTDFDTSRSNLDLSPSISNDQQSRSQLCKEQHSDPEISPLFDRALDENEMSQVPVCYYVKNDILMRKWLPPDVSVDDEWTVNHQIVVPRAYRSEIFNLAHETPMSGHLGINKTYHKILNHFFWPGLKSDVSQHCKSCHTCQMVGKPNQTIPKACLQPIPAFDEPFSRIIIDCVGPLPKTKSGCQYLMTIMCDSTRFPEAIPLRNYTVDKKLSDVNYTVNTPGRRKQKQLCHINMLKKYIDRDSSVISSVNLVNSVPLEQNQMDSEDMNFVQSDPASSKLKNSDILEDLDQKLSHLTSDKKLELKQLILEYEHLFPDIPSKTDKIYHDVELIDGSKPVKQHPYRMNPVKQQILRDEVQYLLDNDFIEPSQSEWSFPLILVPKPDGTFRMCTDYRKVNSVTKTDTFPIPRIDDCIDNIGQAKYVTKFDLLKGFCQIPLTNRAKEISAFVTPDRLYQYRVMPFGMKNSPASFQHLVNSLISNLVGCKALSTALSSSAKNGNDTYKLSEISSTDLVKLN